MYGVEPPAVVVGPSLYLEAVLPFLRGTPLRDLVLVCLLALLCIQGTPVSGRVRRSRTVSSTLSSTVPLQQAACERVLCQVRGCDHAALSMGRTAASCLCPSRSHGQTGTLMISSGFAHLSDPGFLRIVRAVIASPFAIIMDFIQKPTNFQIPSCLRPSCHLSTDPLDTTLLPRTHICPCGVRDLATVRMVPSIVVACPMI